MRHRFVCLLAGLLVACSNDEVNPVDARPVAIPVAIPVANSVSDGTTIRIGTPRPTLGSIAVAVNNRGQVVVPVTQGCCGFIWEGGVRSGTGTLQLRNLNDQSQIVGIANNGHATLYEYPNPTLIDLGTLQQNGVSEAWGINQAGAVVGWASTPAGNHAFIWRAGQGMQDLGTLAGLQAVATDINDAGDVVGYAKGQTSADSRSFFWSQAGGLHDLGLPPNGVAVELYAINNSGVAVGEAMINGAPQHAVLWSAATGWIDLNEASGVGNAYGFAHDINNAGLIAGESSEGSTGPCASFNNPCAVIWRPDYTISVLPVPPGGYPAMGSAARAVNDLGQVVGEARYGTSANANVEATLWQVGTGSGAPVASTTGPYTVAEGSELSLDASTSTDPDGDPLTFIWTFDDGSQPVQGSQVNHVYPDNASPYTVLLTARDPGGRSNTVSTTVTVTNLPPVVEIAPVDSVVTDSSASWPATFSDPGIDDGTYLVTYDWGDGTPAESFNRLDEGPVSRSHSYAAVGSYSLVVSARDRDLGIGADTITVLVVPVNRPPIAASGGPYTGDEDSPIAFNASQSRDFDGDALTFAWNFGDGTTGLGATPSHAYAGFGTYSVSLVVTDAFGLSTTVVTQATIGNIAPSAAAGPDLTVPVGSTVLPGFAFSDPGTGDGPWLVETDWGNGARSGGPYSNQGAINQGLVYQATGTFLVTFTVTDRGGASDADSLIVTVTGNAPPNAGIAGPISGKEGASIFFGSTSTDPNNDPLTYRWTFGDGATSTGQNPSHTYADNGVYPVKLTVTDPKGLSSTATTTAAISNVPPTATFNRPSSINEGKGFTLSLTGANDASSKDRAAGFQFAFNCGTGPGSFGAATSTVCPVQPDNGTLAVSGQIRDKDGGIRQYTGSISVKNVVPKVTISAGGATTITAGTTFSLNGSFTDPGLLDAPWTYSITWGDGTAATTGAGVQGALLTATHRFTRRGTWTIKMTVTDRNGGKGTSNAIAVTVQ